MACVGLFSFLLTAVAQQKRCSAVIIREMPKEKFAFNSHWDYRWDIIKDDNGKFTSTTADQYKPVDTAHLYFTANCKTNVQGGYTIRYCYADFKTDTIAITFVDGDPAYGSYFTLNIIDGRFSLQPHTVYAEMVTGERITYKITRSQLMLSTGDYNKETTIKGYINISFDETINRPGEKTNVNKLYLRGYFKTPIKKGIHIRPLIDERFILLMSR